MVIVDGNNVMGQRVGWHRDKSSAQQRLIGEVGRMARQRNEPHILVFDAKPKITKPEEEERPLLTVLYARAGSSADELILELLYHHTGDADVSIVTSDRALTRQVRVLGARVIRSGTFRRRLDTLASPDLAD
jgi:predicted RNA-binding protein with PIN domain